MLTELQGKAADGTLAKTMAAYVRWLAPQMEKLKATLPARKTALREEISGQLAVHSRTPDIIAGRLRLPFSSPRSGRDQVLGPPLEQ